MALQILNLHGITHLLHDLAAPPSPSSTKMASQDLVEEYNAAYQAGMSMLSRPDDCQPPATSRPSVHSLYDVELEPLRANAAEGSTQHLPAAVSAPVIWFTLRGAKAFWPTRYRRRVLELDGRPYWRPCM